MRNNQVGAMIQTIMALPQEHPTSSSVITGIFGIILIIGGFYMKTQPPEYNIYSIPLILVGLVLLIFVVYAAVETKGFTIWGESAPGHPVARWAGPIGITLTIIVLSIAFVIAIIIGIIMIMAIITAIGNM